VRLENKLKQEMSHLIYELTSFVVHEKSYGGHSSFCPKNVEGSKCMNRPGGSLFSFLSFLYQQEGIILHSIFKGFIPVRFIQNKLRMDLVNPEDTMKLWDP
jgi:hypothetical protein